MRPLRPWRRLWVVSAAYLLLSACVTHYYPAPSGGYQASLPQRDYVAVTAHVPVPQASVTYYVDSVYYPWWSLDYFYLGSGFRYRYGYSGFSTRAYFGPRWGYGWPSYGWHGPGWGSPWYYPPFYTAWYPSHYWRPYYHPRHHYWAHQYRQRPPYGHRPVSTGYGRPGSAQRVAEAPRLRGSGNEEWPVASGTAVRPVSGGTVGGRAGSSRAPVAPAAMARPVAGAYRAPAPSAAEGSRLVARPPGVDSVSPVVSPLPAAKARPADNDARTIRAPVYRPPVHSTGVSQGLPVRSAPTAPQPYAPVRTTPASPVRDMSTSARPTLKTPQVGSSAPAVQRPALPPAATAPRSAPAPRPVQAPRSEPRTQYLPKPVSRPASQPAPRPSSRPVAPRMSKPRSAERPD